jgi:hypothetical protein
MLNYYDKRQGTLFLTIKGILKELAVESSEEKLHE